MTPQTWRKFYTAPNTAEKRWSLFYCVRGALLTALAWTGSVEPWIVVCLFLFEGTKDFFVQRYIQSIRNQFRGDHPRSVFRFCRYYSRRLTTNILLASLTMLIAYQWDFLAWEKIYHLVTSRIGNSTHYLLGFAETEIIAIGILSRRHISNLAGSFATLGSFAASLDLAGVSLYGIRPFWVNISVTVGLGGYYLVQIARWLPSRSEMASFTPQPD